MQGIRQKNYSAIPNPCARKYLVNLFDKRYFNKYMKTLNYVFAYVVLFHAHIIIFTCLFISSAGYLDFRTEKSWRKISPLLALEQM